MKIALAHDHLFQIGGAETVLRHFTQLYPDAPVFTLICDQRSRGYLPPTADIRTSYLQNFIADNGWFKYLLPLMPSAWERFDFSAFDVVLSSSSAFVKGLITRPGAIHISYCHSPTRYLWSDSHEYLQQLAVPRIIKLYLSILFSRLRIADQLAAQRVNYFIANSQFIAERIKKYYFREAVVINPPVDIGKFYVSPTIDPYYLLISRLRPYKRVDLAIKAFNALRLPLIIIGGGEELERLQKLAKPNITFLGEVSDQVRNNYLSRCRALIHPQEEDFGITIVEAMASGRPVIAYGSGGARETVQPGKTGHFFADQSWEALAAAVMHYSPNDFDPAYIRQQAERFDSRLFREKISSFVQSVCP
ncbi:MAG: glycosyltransferase [Candidatus Komeilibacteria bacterium]